MIMGLFGKLKFWKRDEFADFEKDMPPGESAGYGGYPSYGMHDRTAGLAGTEELSKAPPGSYQEGEDWMIRGNSQFERELPTQSRLTPTTLQPSVPGGGSMELLSSKLDTIKAMLESMNQRLEMLERELKGRNGRW